MTPSLANLGLRGRFFLGFSLMALVFALGYTSLNLYTGRASVERVLRTEAHSLASLVAEMSVNNLHALNVDALRVLLKDLRAQEDVSYAYFLTNEGTVLTDGSFDPAVAHQPLEHPLETHFASPETVEAVVADDLAVLEPIYLGQERLGALLVGLSLETLRSESLALSYINVGLAGLLIALSLGTVWLFVGRVTAPLRHMVTDIEAIGQGDFARKLRIRSGGEIATLAKTFNAMTASLGHSQQQLHYKAYHDDLTGLANREKFLTRLEAQLSRPNRDSLALFFIDVDNFKTINDSLGHPAGDQLLKSVAERLSLRVREDDTVARMGGDEFAVLLTQVPDLATTETLAAQFIEMLARPFYLEDNEVFSSVSIGAALIDPSYDSAQSALRDADIALYQAKARGKNQFAHFEASMGEAATRALQLDNDLRLALDRDEFVCHYQPIVRLDTLDTKGFEALVRWQHPERGLLFPGDFLPRAEETRKVLDIDLNVLENASRQTAVWHDQRTLTINVNISGLQFAHSELVSEVRSVLIATGLPASCLYLEITESVLLDQPAEAQSVLEALRDLGVRICLDDFGTGYSSLSYLDRFPIDILKLDRSFVHDLEHNQRHLVIVSAIVAMAKGLGMELVAEGIETHSQLQLLKRLGCTYGQGYYFSKPLPAEDVQAWTRQDLVEITAHPPAAALN